MRKSYLFGCALAALVGCGLGCGGATPDAPATTDQDTGADDTATADDAADDTATIDDSTMADSGSAEEASFDTGAGETSVDDATSADSAGGDTAVASDSGGGVDSGSAVDSGSDSGLGSDSGASDSGAVTKVKTVFVILMENHSWSSIKGNKSAPYINSLLPLGAHAEQYYTPPKNHPSEPNYIWLEAGDNLGITNDNDPSSNHQSTTQHFVTQLETAGVTWKAYQEDITAGSCPLTSSGLYAAKHCPMVFFDDVTETNKTTAKRCIDHVRPYGELATDLAGGGGLARYNFITPNLCHDMHGDAPFGTKCNDTLGTVDLVKMGDTWLSTEVPKILASAAYKDGGALFITWDEGDEGTLGLGTASDGPMGMIVLSPLGKVGYSNSTKYTHSSTLRTFERIFGVSYLRGAGASGTVDLGDLFQAGALP